MTVLRSIAHARGQALPASPLGKVKMVAQVAAILILILGQGHLRGFFVLGQVALWIATVAALVSAVGLLAADQRDPGAASRSGRRTGRRSRADPTPARSSRARSQPALELFDALDLGQRFFVSSARLLVGNSLISRS